MDPGHQAAAASTQCGLPRAERVPYCESTGGSVTDDDRRRFKRLQAPVYCRPVGLKIFERKPTVDISLGGARIYSDDEMKRGKRLEVELFLPDGSSVTCRVEVAWVQALPVGAPAKFDVGLKFTDIAESDRERLSSVLEDG
jgi:hypothetical protein